MIINEFEDIFNLRILVRKKYTDILAENGKKSYIRIKFDNIKIAAEIILITQKTNEFSVTIFNQFNYSHFTSQY